MAPGSKKKNSNRRTIDPQTENKKNLKNNLVNKLDNNPAVPVKKLEKDIDLNSDNYIDKKYSSRTVTSNWQKYEEAPCDPHADVTRGEDFEVLLSYSGGSNSQLQLQDEKEWEEAVNDKTIALDIKDLVHIVKTIPFHKQINLPTSIFSESQLARFNESAGVWNESYIRSENSSDTVSNVDKKMEIEIKETLDSSLNIVDDCAVDETDAIVVNKPVLLEDKTESIIESLASCLSLKTPINEKQSFKEEVGKDCNSLPDDLDFLLSLNVSLKNPVQEEVKKDSAKTNVDDWLNSLLDD